MDSTHTPMPALAEPVEVARFTPDRPAWAFTGFLAALILSAPALMHLGAPFIY